MNYSSKNADFSLYFGEFLFSSVQTNSIVCQSPRWATTRTSSKLLHSLSEMQTLNSPNVCTHLETPSNWTRRLTHINPNHMEITDVETQKLSLTVFLTFLSGHDDWRGRWVCDQPSEQGQETRRQQQHAGRRSQETPLLVTTAASWQGLHPSSNTPCQSSTHRRWNLYWEHNKPVIMSYVFSARMISLWKSRPAFSAFFFFLNWAQLLVNLELRTVLLIC